MVKKQIRRFKKILTFTIIFFFAFGLFFYFQNSKSSKVNHVSEDLKISLDYPKGWYIDDRDYNLLLTNYPSSLNKNLSPNGNQIELYIRKFPRCFQSLEEDLMYPACGEQKIDGPDKIIYKDSRKTVDGTFYKYVTQTPSVQKHTYYLLESGNKILKISKEPDPSQYEKEFEDIINSIRFR